MNTSIVSASPAATHVAYFPFAKDEAISFNAREGFDAAVSQLMARYPNKGVPAIVPIGEAARVLPGFATEATVTSMPTLGPVEEVLDEDDEPESVRDEAEFATDAAGSDRDAEEFATPRNSSFGGELVVDAAAKARIEGQHAALISGGVRVNASEQFYATGTRMADSGYETQEGRKVEHDKLLPFVDVAHELNERIRSEKREDVVMTAGEFASRLTVNGKIAVDGLALREQAIRGLLGSSRLDSPALGYVLGMRTRIADRIAQIRKVGPETDLGAALHAANNADKATIARTIVHECRLNPNEVLKLRTRRGEGLGDVFAIVSKRYAPADAPEVLARVLDQLPRNAKGSWSYDPATTTWELRADVWTPTPVEQQAVGEAFRGYTSFRSRDNGTGRLNAGGGVELLRCLNASTYVAEGVGVQRNHIGRIMLDVRAMQDKALSAIRALCAAWGVARETVIEVPAEAPVGPISKVLEGFWWGELSNRKSELQGVLSGRKADHVEGLVKAHLSERRDPEKLVRSDFAQGWTRYIQGQPADVRRDAESAIGAWIVSKRPMTFDADRVNA